MPDELTAGSPEGDAPPSEGGGREGEGDSGLAETLKALAETQALILETLGKPAAEPKVVPAPTKIEPPPPSPQGRVTRKDWDELMTYAAEQRQRAERLTLESEFGLPVGALEGDFRDPSDMRHTAEMLSLRDKLAVLEKSLQDRDQTPPEGEEGEDGPPEDTGGPTSLQDEAQEVIKRAYEKADALGSTEEGRRARLQAIYADPSKRELITKG